MWIATAWLATGLYIAPAISGHEPKFQKLGVDVLFYALLFIVVGSTVSGWIGTLQHLGTDFGFWVGNQGLEFTSMGRIWQILLFIGLLFWVLLLGRGLMPALKKPSESRGLIAMVFLCGPVHRRFLCDFAGLGPTHALLDHRVLALVVGASVGGRLL